MKRAFTISALLIVALCSVLMADMVQPPLETKDPATNENLSKIYYDVDDINRILTTGTSDQILVSDGQGSYFWGPSSSTFITLSSSVFYVLGSSLSANYVSKSSATDFYCLLSSVGVNYVPYTGAKANINLGLYDFTTSGTLGAGAITGTSLTDTGLTSGRVPYATTGGLLTNSANFTFNTDSELVVTGGLGIGGNNESGNLLTITKNSGTAAAKFQSSTYDAYFLMTGPSTREQYFAFSNYATPGSPIFQVGMKGNNRYSVADNNFTNEWITVRTTGQVGISTISPANTLSVSGGITATSSVTAGSGFYGKVNSSSATIQDTYANTIYPYNDGTGVSFNNLSGQTTMKVQSNNLVKIGSESVNLGGNLPSLYIIRNSSGAGQPTEIEILNNYDSSARMYIETDGINPGKSRAVILYSLGSGYPGYWWSGGPTVANSIGIQEDRISTYSAPATSSTFVIELESQDSYWHTSTSGQNIFFVAGNNVQAVLSNGVMQTTDGSAAGGPGHSFYTDTSANHNGMYKIAPGQLGFGTANTERMAIYTSTIAFKLPTLNAVQPSFLVYPSAHILNVTGDGTAYTVAWDTEVRDQGGNFAANTFTAPYTGTYHFDVKVLASGLVTVTHTIVQLKLVTSNRTYVEYLGNVPAAVADKSFPISVDADMEVGDVATVTLTVSGSSKVVDILAGSTLYSYWSGGLKH